MLPKWDAHYVEADAKWSIRGTCRDVHSGLVLSGVRVTATFRAPVRFENAFRNIPLKTTEVTTLSGSDGQFEVNGEGGGVCIAGAINNYECQPWDGHATGEDKTKDIDMVLKMNPTKE